MGQYPDYNFGFVSAAISGHNVWSNLVRLTRDTLANNPTVLIIDDANGVMNDYMVEAFIRRAWTARPTIKIIWISAPTWSGLDYHDNAVVTTPLNAVDLGKTAAILAHYGVSHADWWSWAKSVVPDTYDLDEIISDGVHPTDIGYAWIDETVDGYLATGLSVPPVTLPERVHAESEDYENESTIKLGTAYDSKTGTWTETGTRVESSEAGATITYSATCQSYGCFRADGVAQPAVEISVDGGAFAAGLAYQNGVEIATGRGAHTITIKVVSGTVRIDEFWAV
jgi:hypothetical protein